MISIEKKKLILYETLASIRDESIVDKMLDLLLGEEYWKPTEEELQGIRKALENAKNGKHFSEEEAKKRYLNG